VEHQRLEEELYEAEKKLLDHDIFSSLNPPKNKLNDSEMFIRTIQEENLQTEEKSSRAHDSTFKRATNFGNTLMDSTVSSATHAGINRVVTRTASFGSV